MSNWTKAGLLEDDGSSQVSSIDSMERDSNDGSVASSLSSVAALRQACTGWYYNRRLHSAGTGCVEDFAAVQSAIEPIWGTTGMCYYSANEGRSKLILRAGPHIF